MTQDYRRLLENGYETICALEGAPHSRLYYLASHIFGFVTYEDEYGELFARKALEVCAAISGSKTYDYIKEPENRLWYLLMVNMPFFYDKLSWGCSVRGAWWSVPRGDKIELPSCGLWSGDEPVTEVMTFTEAQWLEFIDAVLAFGGAT